MRKTVVGMMIAATVMFGGTACNFPSACEGLTASEQDREAAANGYEVEREDSMGNECELSQDGNSWEIDD